MTDLDLERLGDVWRQQPSAEELERLRRAAVAVNRRARFSRVVDAAGAVVAAGLVLVLVLFNPGVRTVTLGSAAIILLLTSNIRLQRLRRIELRSLTGSVEDMLDQSIERVENKLRYQRFCLFAVTPGLVICIVAASALRRDPGMVLRLLGATQGPPILWIGLLVAGIAGTILYLAVSIRRAQQELGRLCSLREACREERASTGS